MRTATVGCVGVVVVVAVEVVVGDVAEVVVAGGTTVSVSFVDEWPQAARTRHAPAAAA